MLTAANQAASIIPRQIRFILVGMQLHHDLRIPVTITQFT
jgi:hypothetical protein